MSTTLGDNLVSRLCTDGKYIWSVGTSLPSSGSFTCGILAYWRELTFKTVVSSCGTQFAKLNCYCTS